VGFLFESSTPYYFHAYGLPTRFRQRPDENLAGISRCFLQMMPQSPFTVAFLKKQS